MCHVSAFACILIFAPFFDSCPFTCGRDSTAEILVALPQYILMLQKQGGWTPAWLLLSHLLLLDLLELIKYANHKIILIYAGGFVGAEWSRQ